MEVNESDISRSKEFAVIGLTLSRLLLAENIARRTRKEKRSLGRIGFFVLADITDGVLARRWGVDTPLRRATDAITDRTSAFIMAKAVFDMRPDTRTNLTILAGREILVDVANVVHLIKTGEVVQGHGIHKIGSLSVAIFGIAASTGSEVASRAVGATANIINAGLATDYVSNAIRPHGEVVNGVRRIQFNNLEP